jgi:hypothetical protein
MIQPAHTPGPVVLDMLDDELYSSATNESIAALLLSKSGEANARLLAAAYNAFDSAARKLGCNAVELAERMQDGNLLTELLTALCLDDLIPDLSAYKPVIEFLRRTSTDLGARP